MGLDFLVPIFGILIVLVPVTGLTAILTLRLGGKPFIETLARELGSGRSSGGTALELKLADLTEQLEALTTEVDELRAAQSFDQRLLESKGTPARTP
jgi:hypothetical protein